MDFSIPLLWLFWCGSDGGKKRPRLGCLIGAFEMLFKQSFMKFCGGILAKKFQWSLSYKVIFHILNKTYCRARSYAPQSMFVLHLAVSFGTKCMKSSIKGQHEVWQHKFITHNQVQSFFNYISTSFVPRIVWIPTKACPLDHFHCLRSCVLFALEFWHIYSPTGNIF